MAVSDSYSSFLGTVDFTKKAPNMISMFFANGENGGMPSS
jgi:hypothetical protein